MDDADTRLAIESYRGRYFVTHASLTDVLPTGLGPADNLLIDVCVLRLHPWLASLATERQTCRVAADESLKSLDGVTPILKWILERGAGTGSTLYVVGGGTVQDAGAFVASIVHRGLRWIYIPTTLLAQGDSCIGSKSSINFAGHKNQLGTFYPPASIVIDERFIDTLTSQEIRSGLGEMLHYAVLGSEREFSVFENAVKSGWRALAPPDLGSLAMQTLIIKRRFIEADEFDSSVRKDLNFGHTFAHGIEYASGGKIPHGVAVAHGVKLANLYARECGILDTSLEHRVRKTLAHVIDGDELDWITSAGVFEGMSKDKKRSGDSVQLILLGALGKPVRLKTALDAHLQRFLDDNLKSRIATD